MNFYQTETPTDGLWKFVKVNGQFRWLQPLSYHSHAVNNGENPEAAGCISIFANSHWYVADYCSSTLKIGFQETTEQEITEILGLPEKY